MTDEHDISEMVLQRFSAISEASQHAPENNRIPDWQGPLIKAGFPLRHVRRIAEGNLNGNGQHMAEDLWPQVATGDCIMLLCGTRGSGKTLMATQWAKRRITEQGKAPGVYTKCADLIGKIKSAWHDGNKHADTEQDILRKFQTTKYLVIDEFHERGASDWEARTLVTLLDHRYDNMLATIIIANLSVDQVHQQVNQSIVDRANETGGMIFCDWPSYRNNQTTHP
jgi:Cdc6-like AAA superfamily ATPase